MNDKMLCSYVDGGDRPTAVPYPRNDFFGRVAVKSIVKNSLLLPLWYLHISSSILVSISS